MFTTLTPTQFEEFCMNLLKLHQLQNVDWRKGTSKDSSPADNGRDIECEYYRYDNILQRIIIEKWFVECKHYKEGVSPDKINGALAWATAERPNRLVIIASGFLSNACKEYLKDYIEKNKPTFSIEIWEKPKLENMASKYPWLLKGFNINTKDKIFDYFNSYHVRYINEQPVTSMDILKQAIALLPEKEKKAIFEQIAIFNANIDQLSDKNIDYEKIIVNNVARLVTEISPMYINSFINNTCNILLSHANPVNIDKSVDKIESLKVYIAKEKDKSLIEKISTLISKDNDRFNKDLMLNLYNIFCDTVVKYILEHLSI